MATTLNALYKKWVGSGPVDVAYLKSVINRDIRAAVAGKIRATPAAVTDWRGDLIAVGKLAKAAHTNPRRKPAKRPRLTPAAIARAHRNPDIHIDIGSHNATRAKGVKTNPKKPRKQIRQRRRQERLDRASSMYKIQIKEGVAWVTHGFSSDLDTAKRYARTLNATEKKPVRVMD